MEVVCSLLASLWFVDSSSVLESSNLRFLGLRSAPAPFEHRSAGRFAFSQFVHLGYPFLVFWSSLRICISFLLSLRHSSFVWPGFLQLLQVISGSMSGERRKSCSRSCCCRGSGHCWDWNVVTLLNSI